MKRLYEKVESNVYKTAAVLLIADIKRQHRQKPSNSTDRAVIYPVDVIPPSVEYVSLCR